MPSRLIREDILDSERVQTLPVEARWLFVAVMLSADDAGLFEAATFKLARRAGIDQNKLPSLLQLLLDSDLIRLYEVEGKRYGFIPRYGQRIQMRRLKHPLPPAALAEGDSDAVRKFNDLAEKSRCISVTHGESPPEAEAEAEEEKVTPNGVTRRTPASNAYRVPDCPYETLLEAFHELLPTLPRVVVMNPARKQSLRARWAEVCAAERFDQQAGIAWFRDFFGVLGRSAFLTGRAKKWKASFDWITDSPKNFAKCVEGNYQDEKT